MENIKYTDDVNFRCLENLRETSVDLYLIHAGWEQCLPKHIIARARDEYIIHFVLSGKGTYSVGGNVWELTQGSMFLICPGEPIMYVSDEKDPWRYCWVGFNGVRAQQTISSIGFSKKTRVLPCPDNVIKSIDKILNARRLSMANDFRRKAYLLELFAQLMDYRTKSDSQPVHHDYSTSIYVEQAIDYIRSFYQQGISVGDVADYVGISRAYLNSSFQKELNMSVQNFLIDFRMHKAANLLVSTTHSVNEVSRAVGYEDPLVFSKAFKKKFELSPKHYREKKEETMDCFDSKQPDPVDIPAEKSSGSSLILP